MLQNFVLRENGLENITADGRIIGYRIKTGLSFYRSVPLSCIEEISIAVDDVEVYVSQISLELYGETYAYAELDRPDIWWDFVDTAWLNVSAEGGLAVGTHKVKVRYKIRIPYAIPVGDDFVVNYDVTNAEKTLEVTGA